MTNRRSDALFIILGVFAAWYTVLLFDLAKIITIGPVRLTAGWFIYTIMWLLLTLTLRQYSSSKQRFLVPLILLLGQTVVFNLSIIFDLETIYPFINRMEHALGTLILVTILDIFLSQRPSFTSLARRYQVLSLTGLALIVATANELIELGMDVFLQTDTIGPHAWDTNLDLLSNSVGLGLFLAVRFGRRWRRPAT